MTGDAKRLISDPYDFHHLTHANPSQVQCLQQARQNDLVTEFSAIRASQKPVTNLKGIRAEDIHFRNFSSEDLAATGVATSGDDEHAFAIPPPAASPPASPGDSSSVSPRQVQPPRESRVGENFSRPVSRYPRTGSGSSIISSPPQRPTPQLASSPEMSEPAPRAIDHVLGVPVQPEHIPRKPSLTQVNLAALFESDEDYGRRPSDTIDPRASSVNLASDLEDVPEEEEAGTGTHWHDSPEQPSEHSGSRRLSPAPEMEPSSVAVPKSHPSIYIAEELSKKFSEALASPTLPQYRIYQQEAPKQSTCPPSPCDPICDSWDADIDYCYEHAAESTSNFDWSRQSLDEPRPAVENPKKQSTMHLSTSSLPCPELDPSPSRSVPSTQLVTPSTAFDGDYFHEVPAIYPEGKQMPDQLFDDYNVADGISLCSQVVQPHVDQVSPRSSFSPISNCNSQESLIISRAASIVRKHRSSASTTSVPDLIHSMISTRENMPPESMPRPESSPHRQTKSLETQALLTGSSASLDSAEVSPAPGVSHDRAKSASDALEASLSKELPPLPPTATATAGGGRKKSRTSYSLFPAAQ